MTNNLNMPPKISVEGKPKYINIGNGQSFFELFRKIEARIAELEAHIDPMTVAAISAYQLGA